VTGGLVGLVGAAIAARRPADEPVLTEPAAPPER
jgi:hypothetical protein